MTCCANQCPEPTSPNEEDLDIQAGSALPAEMLGMPTNMLLGVASMLGASMTTDADAKRDLNQLGTGLLTDYLHKLGQSIR